MIVNIVGTMGAGKTTLVREYMARHGVAPVMDLKRPRRGPLGYHGVDDRGDEFFVVGNYERVSGGCDGIRTQDEVRARIRREAANVDNVLFEGMTVTTSVGTYFKFLRDLAPGDHCFAFLHPPVDVCIERVLTRRAARGADVKTFDPEGVVRHHAFVTRAIVRAREFGAPHAVLNWRAPLPVLERLLRGEVRAAA